MDGSCYFTQYYKLIMNIYIPKHLAPLFSELKQSVFSGFTAVSENAVGMLSEYACFFLSPGGLLNLVDRLQVTLCE